MDFLGKAAAFCGDDAVMGTDVARNAGATFVLGSPQALQTLAASLAPAAMSKALDTVAGTMASHEAAV